MILGEECIPQHRLLCADEGFEENSEKIQKKKRQNKKIKIWKLQNPGNRQKFQEKLEEHIEGKELDWKELIQLF